MSRPFILAYQLLSGTSDTITGFLLIVVPATTLRLMQLTAPKEANVYLSFVGAFVFSVGLAYLFGAYVVVARGCRRELEMIWLLTAIVRASVAVFVFASVFTGALNSGWLTVAATDGALVLIQALGLRKGWLASVNR
jgi:hypothetical protein